MRKLPVFKALGHAIRSTTDNIGFAFHISWPWMLMLLPITIAGNIYLTLNAAQNPNEFDPKSLFLILLMTIPAVIAYSSIAVNWHRYILLDEVAEGWSRLRIDGLMWRYIGNAVGIFLLMFIFGLVVGFIGGAALALFGVTGQTKLIVAAIGYLILFAYVIVWSYRLSLKLPSIAIGRKNFTLRDAWKATDRNFWRILGIVLLFFLCLVLVALAMFLLTYLFGQMGTLGLSVLLAIQVAVNWVATILGVTLLTSLYGFFVEGREF
jgi:hypothetical protein